MKVQHAYNTSMTLNICAKHYDASAVDYLGPVLDSRGRRCGHTCAATHDHPWGKPEYRFENAPYFETVGDGSLEDAQRVARDPEKASAPAEND